MRRYWILDESGDCVVGPFTTEADAEMARKALEQEAGGTYVVHVAAEASEERVEELLNDRKD